MAHLTGRRVALLPLVLLLLLGMQTYAQPPDPPDTEVLRLLNDWRMAQGLPPLKPNPVLDAMAAQQADYLAGLSFIDVLKIHDDAQGRGPVERAAGKPFEWPHYALPERIAITEIAAIGTVRSALGFWQTSAIHTRASLNVAYREVGIATRRLRRDTLFIVVLGSRPNVLPAFVMPEGDLLLTAERYGFSGGSRFIQLPTRYQIFAESGAPLTDGWQTWQARVPIPDGAGSRIFVLSTDERREVLSEVHLARDRAVLPGVALQAVPTAVPPASPTPSNTPPPTATATFTASPTRTGPTDTPGPTATRTPLPPPTSTPSLTPTRTLTPTTAPQADVAILYDSTQLTIHNVSGRRLDISGLVLQGTGNPLPVTAFTNAFAAPIDRFPAGNCLRMYSVGAAVPATPAVCREVNAVLTLNPTRLFWASADFTVTLNGRVLATCPVGGRECRVDLD
jgi:hypothetical protein